MPRRAALVLRRKKGDDVPELDLVEVEPALEYIVGYFRQVGPTMGDKAVTFGEMSAFCDRTGVDLDEFESMAIKYMSEAYLGMSFQAREPQCPCPTVESQDFDELDDEAKASKRADVAKKLGAWLSSVEESHGKGGMRKRK
jgi:hypothetical protein